MPPAPRGTAAQRRRLIHPVVQQHAEAVDGGERVLVPVAERLPFHLQRLAVQRLGGGVVALLIQQQAEADGDECIWVLMKASRSISST